VDGQRGVQTVNGGQHGERVAIAASGTEAKETGAAVNAGRASGGQEDTRRGNAGEREVGGRGRGKGWQAARGYQTLNIAKKRERWAGGRWADTDEVTSTEMDAMHNGGGERNTVNAGWG
jgi:hypothetical protein